MIILAQYKYDIAKVSIKDIKIKPESDDALRYGSSSNGVDEQNLVKIKSNLGSVR